MTLKEILQGRNYEIKNKTKDCCALVIAGGYREFIVQDTDNKQFILAIHRYGEERCGGEYYVFVYGKRKNIAKAVASHMMDELEKMYAEQELEKIRKKEEEESRRKAEEKAAKFEQKKNAVYQNLFDIINSRNI